jgi:hypothetical protein
MMEKMQNLIAIITEEVLKRLKAMEKPGGGTLAVFQGYIFDAEGVADYLKKNHGDVYCAMLGDAQPGFGFKTEKVMTQLEKEDFAGRLMGYERIALVTPSLRLIHSIAQGDDTEYAAMLALRPLLWGREVTVLMDFEAPKNRKSPAFAGIAEDLNALEEMGIKIVSLKKENMKGEEPKELVTEQDVKDAAKSESRKVSIKPGAIVTQLAQDTAKELGVTIEMQGE